MSKRFDVLWRRSQFPAQTTEAAGQPAVFFNGPAGSHRCVVRIEPGVMDESFAEHRRLHGAIAARNLAGTKRALLAYLRQTVERTLKHNGACGYSAARMRHSVIWALVHSN